MSYLVMETKRSYAVLLDQEGPVPESGQPPLSGGADGDRPGAAAGKIREGQAHPPVSPGAGRLWRLWPPAWYSLSSSPCYQQATSVYSSIYMTINPQVRMELNKGGDVIGLAPTNEDGETLLQGYELSEDDPHRRGRRPVGPGH